MTALSILIVNLPIVAVGFLIAAAVLSFRAAPAARRYWRIAFIVVLAGALTTCALAVAGLRRLAY